MILAPPALWPGPRPTRPAARSRPPRAETLPLPATCCWPGSLLRSHPDQPSHGRGNASSRPFGNGRWGGAGCLNGLVHRASAGSIPRIAGHAVLPSLTVNDARRPQDCIGSSWQKAGDHCDARNHKGLGCLEGSFEIGMIRARCRRLDGRLKSLCQMAPLSTSLQRIREVAPC